MNKNSAATILRWGLAFVFFYAAIAGLIKSESWSGYFPQFLQNIPFSKSFSAAFSVYEIILAAFLFWGRRLIWVSLLSAITLAAIVVLNLNVLDITFRDVGLLMAALALYELVRKEKNSGARDDYRS